MSRSAEIVEVVSLLNLAKATLHPGHLDALERALIAPRKLAVEDSPGEFVVAVAAFREALLYWSEVEEGWELAVPSQAGTIPSRGCNQYELGHVLYQAVGPAMSDRADR
jgi:hypothetical protein